MRVALSAGEIKAVSTSVWWQVLHMHCIALLALIHPVLHLVRIWPAQAHKVLHSRQLLLMKIKWFVALRDENVCADSKSRGQVGRFYGTAPLPPPPNKSAVKQCKSTHSISFVPVKLGISRLWQKREIDCGVAASFLPGGLTLRSTDPEMALQGRLKPLGYRCQLLPTSNILAVRPSAARRQVGSLHNDA